MHIVKTSLVVLTAIAALVFVMGSTVDHSGMDVGSVVESAFAFSSAEGTFDRTLNVNGPVDLTIRTGSGHIAVHQGDISTVVIHAKVRARNHDGRDAEDRLKDVIANPPIEQDGNSIEIGRFKDSDLGNNISISYDIAVPAQTRLVSHTGSGGQEIDGIAGPVEARAGSGHIRINNIAGNVEAHTGSGGVDANNVQGGLRASAGSGSIHASNVGGSAAATAGASGGSSASNSSPAGAATNIEAGTGSGGIQLENVKGLVDAHAGSGHVSVRGEMQGDWKLGTGSGGVDVHLPGNAAFDLEAHSSSGGISVSPPITMQGQISRRDIRGKVRGGGPMLEIRTGSGGISVE